MLNLFSVLITLIKILENVFYIGAPYPSISGRSDCTATLHMLDLHSLSQHLLHSTIQGKDMNPNAGKASPLTAPGINTCRKMFAARMCPGPQCQLGTLRHPIFLQLSCSKKTTRVSCCNFCMCLMPCQDV